jgi:aryl-alcohol dehydrogenase-like predicted oxidoreductase
MAGGLLTKSPEYIEQGQGSWDPDTRAGKLRRDLYYKPSYMRMLDEFGQLATESCISRCGLAYRWVRYHSALKGSLGDEMIIGAASAEQLEETLAELAKGPLEPWVVERIDQLWDMVKEDAPVDNLKSVRKLYRGSA